ncbi:PREDICTED: dynactin subunit 3-like, partial [Ceratosolen solmsi marchali]|uniref:Dynactin subunit 3-like n=1 Tax=Ceratosolen solmsi marchali TaxID=326594 RepID=A0AAJ7DWE7_9HYME
LFRSSLVEDVLEARIAEIEKKIFGLNREPNADDKLPENNIIDSLLHANTLITSALSGRDKFNTLIQKLPEIEGYAESDYEQIDLQNDAKLEYILAMEPEIRESAKYLNQLKELLPVLDSDRFNNIPDMSEKLQNLTLSYSKLSDQTESQNEATRGLVSKYNEILTNMSILLIQLDAEVTKLEKINESQINSGSNN